MMWARRIAAACFVALCLCAPAQAAHLRGQAHVRAADAFAVTVLHYQTHGDIKVADNLTLLGVSGGGGTAGANCSQWTTFLARTSGLSTLEQNTQSTLMCGGVTDGWWAKLNYFYWFPTNNTTSASLNWINTSFGLISHATTTFTADTGWAGDGTAGYLSGAPTPSTVGAPMAQDAASIGVCIIGSYTTTFSGAIGAYDGTGQQLIEPSVSDNGAVYYTLDDTTGSFVNPSGNAQGQWLSVRSASNLVTLYKNGGSVAGTYTTASTGLPAQGIYILARNGNGTANSFSTAQLAAAYGGGTLTSADAANIISRIHAAIVAMGLSGC